MKAVAIAGLLMVAVLALWLSRETPERTGESPVTADGPAPVATPQERATPADAQSAPAPSSLARTEPAPNAASIPPAPASPSPSPTAAPPTPAAPTVPAEQAMPRPAPAASTDVEVSPEQISVDLDNLSLSLRDYRTIMAQNPVGTNSEITEALMGANRKGARLAPPDARVNGNGELIDRWGVPYFFHQLSATSMEIHSAGPDKKMGTDDDIIHR